MFRPFSTLLLLTLLFSCPVPVTAAEAAAASPRVVMETSLGTIKIELFDKEAPLSAENFRAYVRQGFYDGLIFHRVIPGFMIQGGGMKPGMKERKATRPRLPNEATNGLKNRRGTLSMARTSDINSATSQFFINVNDNTSLDHQGTQPQLFGYAVFGKVVEGMAVVDKIVSIPTGSEGGHQNVPFKNNLIIKAYEESLLSSGSKLQLASNSDLAAIAQVPSSVKNQEKYLKEKGTIRWGNIASKFLKVSNLIWQDMPENATTGNYWKEAKYNCDNLKIENNTEIMDGFSLPSKEEIIELYQYKDLLKYASDGKYYTSSNWNGMIGGGTYVLDFRDGKETIIKDSNKNDFYYRCVKETNPYANIDVVAVANDIAQNKINKLQILYLPKEPVTAEPISVKTLSKGEFETTLDFEKRQIEEKNSIDKQNGLASQEYLVKHIAWEKQVSKLKADHDEKLKNVDYNQIYWDSYCEAFSHKYGNPRVKTAVYDADKQEFTVNITSASPLISKLSELLAVKIAVPINMAKEVKNIINRHNFQPIVELSIDGDAFHVITISNLNDPNKLIAEWSSFDKSFDSQAELRHFIEQYPSSSLLIDAKDRIAYLDEREAAIEQKLRREASDADDTRKKNLEKAHQESTFLTLGVCEIGGTVIHREKWKTETSSGNILADALFNASTKEEFIIEYEGVVEGFLGDKVKVTINDYRIRQTIGGGILQPDTYRKYEIGNYADKYLGKTQYYSKTRCQ